MAVAELDVPDLALDLDMPADLRRFLEHPAAGMTPAGRLLAAFGLDRRG